VEALVGKVIQTGALESLVMPIYDANCFVSARFAASRFEGIVGGQGESDLPLVIRYVTKRAQNEIHQGDVIITSGLGGIYPSGITIGRVSASVVREGETSMELEVETSADFSRLEYVFVIDRELREDDSGA
jgi:rod shape-determining protein MreC